MFIGNAVLIQINLRDTSLAVILLGAYSEPPKPDKTSLKQIVHLNPGFLESLSSLVRVSENPLTPQHENLQIPSITPL